MKITTERLTLRTWFEEDLAPLLRLNGNAEVNRWLGGPSFAHLGADDILAMNAHLERHRWGVWAICDATGELVGLAGFHVVQPSIPVWPAVEAAWRLKPSVWGRGYIVEAMEAMFTGADAAALPDEVVALIANKNLRSAATASRLGFVHAAERDFDHPLLPAGDPLRSHRVFVRKREGCGVSPPD